MNLNPLSPLTGTPLDECSARELDAWIALRLGFLNVEWHIEFSDWVYSKTIDTLAVYTVAEYTTTNIALDLMAHEAWLNGINGRELVLLTVHTGHCYVATYEHETVLETLCAEQTAPLAICKAWIIAVEAKEPQP